MSKHTRTLSPDDQKAIDVVLNHSVLVEKPSLTPIAPHVSQQRLSAVNKLLALLEELPEVSPPKNLVADTLKFIEQQTQTPTVSGHLQPQSRTAQRLNHPAVGLH